MSEPMYPMASSNRKRSTTGNKACGQLGILCPDSSFGRDEGVRVLERLIRQGKGQH